MFTERLTVIKLAQLKECHFFPLKGAIRLCTVNYLLYQCPRYTTYKISCMFRVGYIWLHVSAVTRPSSGQQGIVILRYIQHWRIRYWNVTQTSSLTNNTYYHNFFLSFLLPSFLLTFLITYFLSYLLSYLLTFSFFFSFFLSFLLPYFLTYLLIF